MPIVSARVKEDDRQAPVAEMRANPRDVALTTVAVLAVIAALHFAEVILVPLVLAVLISYPLDPVVSFLARARVPRALGATLLLTILFGGVGAGLYSVSDDAMQFVDQLPQVARRLRLVVQSPHGANPMNKVQQAAREVEQATGDALPPGAPSLRTPRVDVQPPAVDVRQYLLAGSAGLLGVAAQLVVVVFLALYLLASGDLFRRKIVRIAGPSLTDKKITLQILQEIDRQIAIFLVVRLFVSVIVGVATWLALELIGLQHAALWGVTAGLLNTIPYLGPVIVAAAVAVVAFLQFGTVGMAAVASGATSVITALEGYLLTPCLTSRAAQMNAVAVFVGLLFWGWVWGVWGMLLAVPMLMVLKAVSDRIDGLRPVAELLGE